MSDYGQRILDGLKDAVEGNFARVTMEGQTWEKVNDRRQAANSKAWAIGAQQRNGFKVRRVVWGRLMARAEKRKGEQIRRATIYVGSK